MKYQVQSRRLLAPVTNKWMMITIVPHRPIVTHQGSQTSSDQSNINNNKNSQCLSNQADDYYHHPTAISVYQVSPNPPHASYFSSSHQSDIFSPTVNTVFDE
ncbi:hypothetical protein BCR42DRAFT_438859 [Absidia repens]|uniref:Uncharacterized protein n=1 Tax=Absidia repens TaxID=90262 RepID=A0A1X2IE60_9FUNG|nr:hypothetical protein BCR42DRAFT_438859 [Absidia repens]